MNTKIESLIPLAFKDKLSVNVINEQKIEVKTLLHTKRTAKTLLREIYKQDKTTLTEFTISKTGRSRTIIDTYKLNPESHLFFLVDQKFLRRKITFRPKLQKTEAELNEPMQLAQ